MLFSSPMVLAELEGRKTKTRRTKGLEPINDDPGDWQFEWAEPMRNIWTFTQKSSLNEQSLRDKSFTQFQTKCPYGRPGDILWVRETFRKYCKVDENGYTRYDQEIIEFAADKPPMINECDGDGFKMFNKDGSEKFIPWKPSIHMPKVAARIWLQVTDVRVERLQDISTSDIEKEGIGLDQLKGCDPCVPASVHFHQEWKNLWTKINGPESWEANPFVWVISFRVLSTTGKPDLKNLKAIV